MSLLVKYTKQELIDKLSLANLPVLIYGAGVAGQALLVACNEIGIDVECFFVFFIKKKGQELLGLQK